MTPLRELPGRLRAWLGSDRKASEPQPDSGAGVRAPAGPQRDLSSEFDRFLQIGERLERGLEELKDIQWEIRENEARFRDLLDNQADVILRRDAEGRLTFVNQAFCRVFGLERRVMLGQVFAPNVISGEEIVPLAPGAALRQQRRRPADRAGSNGRSTPSRPRAPPCLKCNASAGTSRRGCTPKLNCGRPASRRRLPTAPSRASSRP